jgi:hypothetical protein
MEIEKNQIFELVIEDEETDEVFAISLVETPAIESNFVFFDKEEVQFAAISDDKRLLMGPILVPDKKILRMDGANTPYFVFFKPETIKRLSEMYLQKKYTDKATLEHDKKLQGVSLVESWVVESREKDKSSLYGLNVPVGTWMGTFKVDNDEIWNDYVKTGEVKGFSIEGLFGHNLVQQTKYEFEADTILNDLEEQESILILSEIRALIKKDNRYKDNKRVDMESYSDYGSSVSGNAKRGIELNEKNGNKCATPVGKVRAQQLAQGRPISIETIKRMYSYLSRAEVYYDNADSTSDCGYISFLLWGGKSALSWSRNKLRELGLLQESAEVGPRGGIKESPKAPKSDTKNPDPKGEGTAKGDASGKRGAKVTAEQEKTLEDKVKEFNERESNTKNGNATLGALKSVFQRGLGAFNTSHSPRVQSAEQWAYARVNAYLYLLKNGRPENPKYTTDYDLLPKGHPKADTKMEAQPSVTSTYPGQAASGSIAPALLAQAPNLDVYGYETKYFQICPGAQKTFTEIVSLPNNEEYIGMVRSAAVVADAIFKIENDVLEAKKATPQQLKEAILLVEDYKDIIHEIDEEHGIVSDISYMDGHIKTIQSFV